MLNAIDCSGHWAGARLTTKIFRRMPTATNTDSIENFQFNRNHTGAMHLTVFYVLATFLQPK
jgi:hypothetical protein